jgi:PAS domain S-box-containing protein
MTSPVHGPYRDLVDLSLDGILLQSDGIIAFANAAAQRMIGAAGPEAIVGRRIDEFMPPPYLPLARDELMAPDSPRVPFIERPLRRLDGSSLDVEMSAVPFLLDDRPSVQVVLRDIRERVLTQQRASDSLSSEAVALVAGGVAHEINNALAIIAGSAVALQQRGNDDPDTADLLLGIVAATARAAETTRDLLAFAVRGVHRPKRLSLEALVRDVVQALRLAAPATVSFATSSSPGLPDIVCDEVQLSAALTKVCWNAVEAMTDGGLVEIALEATPSGGVQIHVIDKGVGMSPEVARRAFDPFFSAFSGNHVGLGLSMAQGVVKQHNGLIRLESQRGEGTTVTIELHAAPRAGPPTARARRVDVSHRGWALVVDDEPVLRQLSARMIGRLGYSCMQAADGLRAIEAFREDPLRFAFVLLDIVMPGLSGLQVLSQMRAIDPDVRVILYSGYPRDDSIAAVCTATVEFLAKPFKMSELDKLVCQVTAPAEAS